MNLKKSNLFIIIFLITLVIFTIMRFLVKGNKVIEKISGDIEVVEIKKQNKSYSNKKVNSSLIKEKSITKEKNKKGLLESFDKDIVFGNLNAPVTIIEYSSFTCSHCIKMHNNVMESLKRDYIDTNKVKFIHRAMVNSRTIFSKMLQHCANKKSVFNLTTDLFNTSGQWAYSENILDQLERLSSKYGMKEDDFNKCIQNKELGQGIINRQLAATRILKVNSTPTVFINKERISGARSYKELKKIIDKKLLEIK